MSQNLTKLDQLENELKEGKIEVFFTDITIALGIDVTVAAKKADKLRQMLLEQLARKLPSR